MIPKDIIGSLGKCVTSTTYIDSNLYHDMITGCSVSCILHLLNKTSLQWHPKKQGTLETATYESELVSARITKDRAAHRLSQLTKQLFWLSSSTA